MDRGVEVGHGNRVFRDLFALFVCDAIRTLMIQTAAGIIVPQVNTVAEAGHVVRFSRYALWGSRGVGIARANGYGLNLAPYVASDNDTTIVIVQAEDIHAADNIEPIVKVPGIDSVLVGP
ncbi:HpcH/HpaI aldolase/citrate lyase family protein [Neorhodopirellula lusitana]|uniref:HpcH/HpaI aldolase/citrate lyase family protein n=2 Tax=Neorhodopirellula lusitana TaxID=445327 RepID=A0ABY1Q4Q7_9BACT|nr:HpcH/HpaI aldolase/citrate lyase family protein [Neorhodopirellula lusitana]